MFLDEGRIAGLVRHPHVVSVVDVGEDEAGPYLVMDFVEGVSLAELIARAAARGEHVPMTVALRIAAQVAAGLHAVHETRGADGKLLQLIHRDVSPQNVLIAFDGTARVSDFGIAKALGRATRTTTGVLKGKVGYLAPDGCASRSRIGARICSRSASCCSSSSQDGVSTTAPMTPRGRAGS